MKQSSMKTSHFLAIVVVAFTLLSCTNEESPVAETAGRSKLSILIKGETDAPRNRAVGAPTQADESKVNNFILFVFKGSGANDIAPREYSSMPTGNTVAELEVTTDAREVYVIANTGSSPANAALKAITKKSDLQAVVGRGFATISATDAPTQSSTNLWMSGSAASLTPVDGGNVAATVTLKYVAAKVRITSVTVTEDMIPGLPTKLTFLNVIVFNGAAATHFIPTTGASLIPTFTASTASPFYVSGVAMDGLTEKPTVVGRNNEYAYTLTGDQQITTSPTASNQQYFYVFENDGVAFESRPTIVALKGVDDKSNDVFYPVFFKMNLPDAPLGYDNMIIERGKSYDIALTIKKLGTKDPTVPLQKTTVDITVTPATWQTETINKTFE